MLPSQVQFNEIRSGYQADPQSSLSLRAEAYTDPAWFAVDQQEIILGLVLDAYQGKAASPDLAQLKAIASVRKEQL